VLLKIDNFALTTAELMVPKFKNLSTEKTNKKFNTTVLKTSSNLDHQILVVPRSEEFVDEEWPGHQYEEQGVAELRLKRKT
jgi:hypothetical protein